MLFRSESLPSRIRTQYWGIATTAPVVPPGCMCADLVDGTATVEIAVAGDIEMIADIGKSSRLV